jgi:hypothetical protein
MYGLGNVVSVRFPQALPDSPTSVWSTSTTGTGCAAVVAQSVTMAVEFAALAPVAALVVVGLTVWPPALAVACPVALAEGVGVWLLGRNVAAGWLDAHQAELAQALSGPP